MTDEDQPGEMPEPEENNPASQAMPYWERLIEDMEVTAEEYRDRGWKAVEVHPGDVSVFPGEQGRRGIELLAPDNEFDPLAEAFDEAEGFDSGEVYRASENSVLYFLVVMEDERAEVVILLPAYYNHRTETDFVEMLQSASDVPIHVRPLNERRILTFAQKDPSLFLPE